MCPEVWRPEKGKEEGGGQRQSPEQCRDGGEKAAVSGGLRCRQGGGQQARTGIQAVDRPYAS